MYTDDITLIPSPAPTSFQPFFVLDQNPVLKENLKYRDCIQTPQLIFIEKEMLCDGGGGRGEDEKEKPAAAAAAAASSQREQGQKYDNQ